ncbi:HTH domain-containing protein [Candidatus Kaiserbacteria bacterium]|nr:HTH domain-containing protein [Candidatus Kaiserbacteria bacterium]
MCMPPEATSAPDAPQPTEDSPSPVIEAPTPTDDTTTPPQEAPSTGITSEAAPSEPEQTSATQTAQIPPNEPLPPEPEPFDSAQDKPIAPEPPSSAASTPAVPTHSIRDLLSRARIAIQDRKRKKRDKIMQILNTKSKITNDEVEKLLHVSDATATRYLSALEKEGKIKQIGKTGHGVVYSKI